MPFDIKEQYKKVAIGYNNSAKPIGERDDLHLLAELSYRNPTFADYFENFPTDAELVEYEQKYNEKRSESRKNKKKNSSTQILQDVSRRTSTEPTEPAKQKVT